MPKTDNNTSSTSPFSDEELNELRMQGDPLADEVIDVFAKQYSSSISELTENLQNMIRMPSDDEMLDVIKKQFPQNNEICVALEKYFVLANKAPSWADAEKLTLGGHVFQDHMFSGFIMLACSSLPICYTCIPDVKVLSFTRRLIDKAPKRIAETVQMITDVMGNGGLSVKDNKLIGKGIQSILKIRLLHASIRYLMLNKAQLIIEHSHKKIDIDNFLVAYVLDSIQDQCNWHGTKKPKPWDIQHDNVPINGEALALTLLTFSYVILRGLKDIGVKINPEQQNAYLHSWNVVGSVLGVNEKVLAEFNTYEKSEVIFKQIMQRRRGYSEDGELLQQALLNSFSAIAWKVIPFPLKRILHVRRLARLITSIMISKKSYAALGLKLSFYDRFIRFLVWLGIRIFGFCVNWGLLRPFADYMFKHIAKSLWDWRDDFSDDTQTTIYKPLVIPHRLIATSYLADNYKK